MAKKRKRIEELERETQKPDFWQDPEGVAPRPYGARKERAIKISQELARLREEIREFKKLKNEAESLKEAEIKEFEKRLEEKELKIFLSGKYDKNSALLTIQAGAGGQDAQDWATMLLRMYERYCAQKGFKTKILHQSFGEGGGPEGRIGTKSATLEIQGPFAYGFLKKESGVHRLVRISPFSPQKLRHTSFALVEVLPEIEKEIEEIKIRPENLKIDFFRASGPGGQYVNKRETAVRITHLPTGITATCQSERLQGQNRERAIKMLYSKLYQLKGAEKKKEISKIKGKIVSASWGNQIRSYVLHPYKIVKDLRTDVESSGVEGILDGNLDEFVKAEIQLTN